MSNTFKLIASILLSAVSFSALQAQKGLRIEARIANLKPAALILAQYFGGELMPVDTAIIGADGKVVWEEKQGIPPGMCRILGFGRGLDIVVADSQRFSFEADMKDPIATIRFQNSSENTLFFNYQREVRKRYQQALNYRQQMGIKDDNDPRWKSRFQELNEDVKKHVDSLYQKYPNLFAVHFLKSYQEPKLPVLPLKYLSAKDSAYLQSYTREHFFDNSFLSDERMVYTPTVPVRFERFLKALPLWSQEEQLKMVDKVVQQTKGTVELRKYIVGRFAQEFELTPSASMDKLYKHIVQNYIEAESNLWDASTLQKIKEVGEIKAKLAVGTAFPNLLLTDLAGKEKALESVKSDYTVLFFYDPGCSHCRQTTPKLTALANKYADKMQVYAISLDAEANTLKNFVEEFKTQNFVNVRDASRKIEFYKLGVFNYPTIYLLDRDKKIVARWLTVEQLATYLLNR
ncbi:redoxin domain-containing protein [Runella sp.]|uniref:redoxin domain-containing protein n=1 Tax=Runella sp. TaxID=1960881 RepID=UPI003D0D5258